MIALTLYATFVGAFLLLLLPRAISRWIALLTAGTGLVVSLIALFSEETPGVLKTIIQIPWIPALGGMSFHLAADGISLTMAVVTGLTGVGAILFSWNVDRRQNEFFFWLLLVIGGSYGVFLSADLFLFFVFYELVIIPKYMLIATWGSTNKAYGAMKLTLYSFLGGALVLIAMIPACITAGTTDIQQLSAYAFAPSFQAWAFPVMFLGFGVLAGIWPFHTWAPTGHSAAPTAGSMLLAGVVMKLGAYGALRVAMNFFPDGYQSWRPAIAILAIIGICYAAGVALRQNDLKFVIGYSSVSHMGFVLLGLATAQRLGIAGAVLQMFSHGVIAGLLFAVAGRMIYERTHSRDLAALSEMKLNCAIPFAFATFIVACAASMGIPGFSGFAAEITILIGLWHAYPIAVPITGIGMVMTAAFTLRALRYTFFGEKKSPSPPLECVPITLPEKCGAILLMSSTLAVGVYPMLLLNRILPCVETMRFLKR